MERVSSSVNLTTLAPGVKTCIERATETKEEEEERRRKKKEEGRRPRFFFFFLELSYTHTKKVPADSFALRCMYLKKRAVFDETNRKIPHFTRVVQSARCERSWGEERDVSTKN